MSDQCPKCGKNDCKSLIYEKKVRWAMDPKYHTIDPTVPTDVPYVSDTLEVWFCQECREAFTVKKTLKPKPGDDPPYYTEGKA